MRKQAEEMRVFSDREDRMYREQAVNEIERRYWTVRDGKWLGKMPDSRILEFDSPRLTPAALPSRAFYRGWHLQLTVSSDDWRAYPEASGTGAFKIVYAITRESARSWDIRVMDGAVTAPLKRDDLTRIRNDEMQ